MVDHVILELLEKRGITEKDDIEEFLSSKPKRTYDPFLLLNMREGVDLILEHIDKGNKICIYGDYDCDGITSISILKHILKEVTENLIYRIPSRFTEGYGLNCTVLDELKNQQVDLIITVDCGITAVTEVEYAKSLGMDILVTDHHTAENQLPNCLIINPKQKGCPYPFKELAGCGVAFKLAQAIQQTLKLDKKLISEVLDILSIGTVGDVVTLLDENRTFVKYGISMMNKNMREGISYLLQTDNYKSIIDSQKIAFSLVPNLNAAGRIESATIGVKLFDSTNQREVADQLLKFNQERKRKQQELFEKCKNIYERQYMDKKFPLIILDEAHEGVMGIVAGKMKDYIKKPVALLTKDHHGKFLKATARGIESINIYEILSHGKELFEKFGGHKGACGFSITEENYIQLDKIVSNIMADFNEEDLKVLPSWDILLESKDINIELTEKLKILEPFGQGNKEPVFKVEKCRVKSLFFMGENKNHLKINLKKDDLIFDCVVFNYRDVCKFDINVDDVIDVIGNLNVNVWNNKKSIQFMCSFIDLN